MKCNIVASSDEAAPDALDYVCAAGVPSGPLPGEESLAVLAAMHHAHPRYKDMLVTLESNGFDFKQRDQQHHGPERSRHCQLARAGFLLSRPEGGFDAQQPSLKRTERGRWRERASRACACADLPGRKGAFPVRRQYRYSAVGWARERRVHVRVATLSLMLPR